VDRFGLMGDRGYRGCEYVEVCESKEQKGIRQVVEAVNSQIKLFNGVSRWRNITTLLAYLQGYTIGYSFFRKSWLFK
jgi:glycine/serine hydroxymethyltransferase